MHLNILNVWNTGILKRGVVNVSAERKWEVQFHYQEEDFSSFVMTFFPVTDFDTIITLFPF